MTLTADFTRSLPGGKLDDSTYEAIESALDRSGSPIKDGPRWLTLPERVDALFAEHEALITALRFYATAEAYEVDSDRGNIASKALKVAEMLP